MKKLIVGVLAVVAALAVRQWLSTSPKPPVPNPGTRRIVSLAPNLTGILFDLGAGSEVVGVTAYCDYPEEATRRTRVGDFINPNFEKIVSLHPDLIVAERWSSSKVADRLRRLGLRVEEFPTPKSLREIYGLIEEVGVLLGRREAADQLLGSLRGRVERIRAHAHDFRSPPKVYLEIDLPTWTVGSANFTSEAIEICGGENVFSDLTSPASQVSSEVVIERNPDIIVSFAAKAAEIRSRTGWDEIAAVRDGRVIDDFPESLLSQGNERLVDGMELLQRRMREVMGLPAF